MYVDCSDKLFVFIKRRDAEPTNNESERALRPSVIFRKVTNGFRSEWGAKTYAALCSIVETGRRNSRNALTAIRDALASPATQAAGPRPAPHGVSNYRDDAAHELMTIKSWLCETGCQARHGRHADRRAILRLPETLPPMARAPRRSGSRSSRPSLAPLGRRQAARETNCTTRRCSLAPAQRAPSSKIDDVILIHCGMRGV